MVAKKKAESSKRNYYNMSQYVSICLNMSQYVSICLNMSKYVYYNISLRVIIKAIIIVKSVYKCAFVLPLLCCRTYITLVCFFFFLLRLSRLCCRVYTKSVYECVFVLPLICRHTYIMFVYCVYFPVTPFTPVLPCIYDVSVWMCVDVALHLSPHIHHISVLSVFFYDAFHASVAIYIRCPCINVRLCCPFHVCVTIQVCVGQHNVYKCAFVLPFFLYKCAFVLPFVLPYTHKYCHTYMMLWFLHDVMLFLVINMTIDEYGFLFYMFVHLCCPTHLCCHTYMMLACCVRCCLSILACLNMYICVCVFDSVCGCVCEHARVCMYAPFTPVLPRVSKASVLWGGYDS